MTVAGAEETRARIAATLGEPGADESVEHTFEDQRDGMARPPAVIGVMVVPPIWSEKPKLGSTARRPLPTGKTA